MYSWQLWFYKLQWNKKDFEEFWYGNIVFLYKDIDFCLVLNFRSVMVKFLDFYVAVLTLQNSVYEAKGIFSYNKKIVTIHLIEENNGRKFIPSTIQQVWAQKDISKMQTRRWTKILTMKMETGFQSWISLKTFELAEDIFTLKSATQNLLRTSPSPAMNGSKPVTLSLTASLVTSNQFTSHSSQLILTSKALQRVKEGRKKHWLKTFLINTILGPFQWELWRAERERFLGQAISWLKKLFSMLMHVSTWYLHVRIRIIIP